MDRSRRGLTGTIRRPRQIGDVGAKGLAEALGPTARNRLTALDVADAAISPSGAQVGVRPAGGKTSRLPQAYNTR